MPIEVSDASRKLLPESVLSSAREYLDDIKADLVEAGYRIDIDIRQGDPTEEIVRAASRGTDLLIMTNRGKSMVHRWVTSGITQDVIHHTTPPLIILRPTEQWRSIRTRFKRLLVTLDGSQTAELVLPFAREIASKFMSTVSLLMVPEASDTDEMMENLRVYLNKIALDFTRKGIVVNTFVVGEVPSYTILDMSEEFNSDLVMMVSHGRGGIKRQKHVKLGSVTESVLKDIQCPLFLVSAQ